MAGHSHWAGIKHKKGRQDKQRANLFSKLSREITVAAKLGAKDPDSNPRLRSAIQAARQSNMPKDNIERAINKSDMGVINVCSGKPISVLEQVKSIIKENNWNIKPSTGHYDYPDYEPFSFWGIPD